MKKKKIWLAVLWGILCIMFVNACSYFSTEDTVEYKDCEGGKMLSKYEGISTSYEFTLEETSDGLPVVEIAQFVFSGADNLKKINLGKNVQRISCRSFCNIPNLEEFTVSNENEYFTVQDGVLYNKDMTVLLAYPNGRAESNFVVPDSVQTIGECAFYMCSNLKTLTLGEGVKKVEDYACIKCTSLSTLTLNEGLEEIGRDGFSYCNALTELHLPSTLQKLGDYAFFSQSSKIESFTYSCDERVFDGVKDWQPRRTAYPNSAIAPTRLP